MAVFAPAIVNCHGSLCVIDGGVVSFGCSPNLPAANGGMAADVAPANKKQPHFHVPSSRVMTF